MVMQACIFSSVLFNIYGEHIVRKNLDGWNNVIIVGGSHIHDIQFADDTTLCATSKAEMKLKAGTLAFNIDKTKINVINRADLLA